MLICTPRRLCCIGLLPHSMPVPWLQLGGSVLSVFGTSYYAHVIKAVANGDIIYGPCELRVRAGRKRNTTRCRVRRYGRSVGLSITADVTVAIEPIAIVEATQRLLYIDELLYFPQQSFLQSKGDDTHSNNLRQYYGTTFLRHNIARLSMGAARIFCRRGQKSSPLLPPPSLRSRPP